jgi:hypothetical protein
LKIEELKNNQRLINNLLKKLKLLIREFFCVKILFKKKRKPVGSL